MKSACEDIAFKGQVYNYYRDYDPGLGRYLQSDPIGVVKDYSDPQLQLAMQSGIPLKSEANDIGLNHNYGYINGNPIQNIDLFGLYVSVGSIGVNIGVGANPMGHGGKEVSPSCFQKCLNALYRSTIIDIVLGAIPAGKVASRIIAKAAGMSAMGGIGALSTAKCIADCSKNECE